MADYLWTTFIADNGSNDILAASSADGVTWTPSVPINQTSPFTPSMAVHENILYCAFITDDEDSQTGTPSNRIFLCWTTDGVSWSPATFINQYSKCAPSLGVWNDKLHIAFVSNDPSNRLLVYYSSTPQNGESWAATVATNQTSANAPAIRGYQPAGGPSQLYMAFVAENGSNDIFVCSIAAGGQWSSANVTGQSCHFSPSLTVVDNTLSLVFAAANGSKDLLLSTLQSNGSWSGAVPMNQSSSATPCATEFGGNLAAAFVANNSSGEVLLASAANPTNPQSWTGANVDVQQQSAAGPALSSAPFPCCWQLVSFPGKLKGNSQYVLWGGLGTDNRPVPITGLVVEISIDEAIIVSPTSGVTPSTPNALPIGFQINGVSPVADTQPGQVTTDWTPTAGDQAIGWVQYGVKMWPATTMLIGFAEYWPPSVFQNPNVENTFNLSVPNSGTVTLPNDLTIPAGWTIRFVFSYSQQLNDGTITGYTCTVKDENGNEVSPPMVLNFLDPPNQLANGGAITLNNLCQVVAFQVLLVGFWSSADATMTSGGGTITVQATTPMTVQTSWPVDGAGSGGTAENANSTYSQLPACQSKSFTQTFGVS
jgi:hypothetical protein